MPANKILVFSLERSFGKKEKGIKTAAGKILQYLQLRNAEVEIYLAGDKVMKVLNKKFRGKNKAANVLSFSEPENFVRPPLFASHRINSAGPRALGEIYLNMGGIKEFSLEALLVHGILHLLEFDHERESDRIKMEKLEKEIIRDLHFMA